MSVLPGPVSNAIVGLPPPTSETFAMPPMLRSAIRLRDPPKTNSSKKGTSGAPCPPAAMSRGRKSATTSTPVSSAMIDGSPTWSVWRPGSCHAVWPCDPMTTGRGPLRMTSRAADANRRPRRTFASLSWEEVASRSASTARCSGRENASVRWRSTRTERPGPIRTRAAETPSPDVPDMSPTATVLPPFERPTEIPPLDRQQAVRLARADLPLQHDDGRLHAAARRGQRGTRIEAGQFADDAGRADPQLPVRRLDIHHQVLMTLAELRHHRDGDRVKDELRGGPGLEARRSGDDSRSDSRRDVHVGAARRRSARQEDRRGPIPPGATQGRENERRGAARGDPDHRVSGSHVPHRRPARSRVVLGALDAARERARASRDHGADQRRRRSKGRRTLRGFEGREPAARAGAHEEETAPAPEVCDDQLHGASRGARDARDGRGDRRVLPVDAGDDGARGKSIEVPGPGIAPLGARGHDRTAAPAFRRRRAASRSVSTFLQKANRRSAAPSFGLRKNELPGTAATPISSTSQRAVATSSPRPSPETSTRT